MEVKYGSEMLNAHHKPHKLILLSVHKFHLFLLTAVINVRA